MEKEKETREALVDVLTKRWVLIEKHDLYFLTKFALIHEEITVSKASELLGLPLEDVRCLLCEWSAK